LGRPCLAAVISLNPKRWASAASALGVNAQAPNTASAAILGRISHLLCDLPRHAQIRAVHLVLEPWTIQQGLLTPTLKIKRQAIEERYAGEIALLYEALKEARQGLAAGRASAAPGSPNGVGRLDVAEP
jgi:long-chain acyl-CoA synthetase